MNETAEQTDAEISQALIRLRKRKEQLEEVMKLQEEISAMEVRLLLGKDTLATVSRVCVEVVCEQFGLAPALLSSRCREERVAWPRQIAWHLIKAISGGHYTSVGRLFGRDHSTILYGCQTVQKRMEVEPETATMVEAMEVICHQRLGREDPK